MGFEHGYDPIWVNAPGHAHELARQQADLVSLEPVSAELNPILESDPNSCVKPNAKLQLA